MSEPTLPIRPAAHPQDLRAVVFDMDGLLLDSEAIFKLAWKHAAGVGGYDLPDDVFYRMIGRTREDSNRILVEAFGGKCVPENFSHEVDTFHDRYVRENGIPLKAGVEEILDWCDARGLPRAVATSTYEPLATPRLAETGLLPRFSIAVFGDHVSRGKPNPDIYLRAAERLGVEPSQCLALEDSYNGVRAARAAGMTIYMVPDLLRPTAEMVETAHGIFPSLHAVVEFLNEAPTV